MALQILIPQPCIRSSNEEIAIPIYINTIQVKKQYHVNIELNYKIFFLVGFFLLSFDTQESDQIGLQKEALTRFHLLVVRI